MDINHHIGSLDVFDDGMGGLLGHSSLRVAWKDAVHVEVEVWYATLYGVDAKRIDRRVNLECTH